MKSNFRVERLHTIVIGGGQAGLSVGYYLAKQGVSFLILDAKQRVGDAWRQRWDSLRLFTPARYVNLPGMHYPGPGDAFPTKDDIANYLEQYAAHFRLPVQTGVTVDRVAKEGDHFVVTAGDATYECDNLVIAMANYQAPRVPQFSRELDTGIVQIHSHNYKNPSQLQEGAVLVVGVGNSGADIGIEVAQTHPTWISGKESGFIPWNIDTYFARNVAIRLVRFLGHHILTAGTPIGRKRRPKMIAQATPLIRVKPKDLTDAGIQRVGRVAGVRNGRPLLADGRVLDVKNVIWCTGYEPGFSWIDLPVFDRDGQPIHSRGVVAKVPGLYFVGLHFQYAMTSATVTGVRRDAEYVVRELAARSQALANRSRHLRPVSASAAA